MSRKAFVEVKVRIVLEMDEGIAVSDVISDMDYGFNSKTDGASVSDTEIIDHEVTDSK